MSAAVWHMHWFLIMTLTASRKDFCKTSGCCPMLGLKSIIDDEGDSLLQPVCGTQNDLRLSSLDEIPLSNFCQRASVLASLAAVFNGGGNSHLFLFSVACMCFLVTLVVLSWWSIKGIPCPPDPKHLHSPLKSFEAVLSTFSFAINDCMMCEV